MTRFLSVLCLFSWLMSFCAIHALEPNSLNQLQQVEAHNLAAQRGNDAWISDWTGFLAKVRKKALDYTNDLPNFVCTETVRRYVKTSTDNNIVLDEIVGEVSFFEKKERYKVLRVGNKPHPEGTTQTNPGMTSIGEFGGSLNSLFDPLVNAEFKFAGISLIRGHRTVCIKYEVPLRTSRSVVSIGTESVTVAYRGRCCVEPDSYHVVQLQDVAVGIPGTFPITESESMTEYDVVNIAGKKFWLPVSATVRMVAENDGRRKMYDFYRSLVGPASPSNFYPPKIEARNIIVYSDYHKFQSEVKITF